MRKHDRSATKAGLFIIASLFLLLGIIVSIKGLRSIFTPVVERQVRFALTDDIGGLRLGDDVRLGGFKIGVIKAIEVMGVEDGQQPRILINFTAPEKYPLRKSAHIAVQGTLTGSSWLNIDDLGTGVLLADGDELTGHPSASSELIANLSKSTPDIQAVLSEVKNITIPGVDKAIERSHGMIDSIHAFADRGSETAVKVRDLLGDSTPDIKGTLANLNSVTTKAKTDLPQLLEHADAAVVKITTTIENAKGTLEDLKIAMTNAKELTTSAKSILVGNRYKFDSIISSLKSTGENLQSASVEVRRSPWRLLYKPAPGEMENLNLFDAAREFAEGANSVNDAAINLRDASHDPTVSPEQLQKLVEKLDQSFTNFHEVEQKLWTAVKE
jgi:ABC-type transporter Mla subunit MlaD